MSAVTSVSAIITDIEQYLILDVLLVGALDRCHILCIIVIIVYVYIKMNGTACLFMNIRIVCAVLKVTHSNIGEDNTSVL